jgi:hypothetical protein
LAEDGEGLDEQAGHVSRRSRLARRIGGGVALAALIATGGLWLARKPIADSFIARELAARGVQGRYLVTRIGPRTQRLDNLVIGDPRSPDLTAKFVEIDIGWGFSGARITRVQASGVRLRGRLKDGSITLGQIDRLLTGGGGEATLPDWLVELDDMRADIATDYGALALDLQGRGPLRSGFGGTLGLASPGLRAGDCQIGRFVAPLDVASEDERILIKGPVSTAEITCPSQDFALRLPKLNLNLRTDMALADMSGAISLFAEQVTQGRRRADRLSGLLTASGGREALRGSASLSVTSSAFDGLETGAAKLGGNFALRPMGRDKALAWQGLATIDNARPARGLDLKALMRSSAGTPLEPLADKLARAIVGIGKANRLTLGGKVNLLGTRGNATLDRLELAATSGARIKAASGSAVRYDWPDGQVKLAGALEMGGGNLPEGRVTVARDVAGQVTGTATFAEYRSGTARLALAPVRFAVAPGGAGQVSTVLTLDGPLPQGAIRGLNAPIAARFSAAGDFALIGDCAPVRWQSLRLSSLSLDPATLRLCGLSNSEARLAATRLTGRLGESPLAFSAAGLRYALATGQFTLDRPDVRIGTGEYPVRLAALRLSGAAQGDGGLAGTIEGGGGRIASVPLDLADIAGRWTFAAGRFDLTGGLRVSDTQADARFNPLAGEDVHLTLANNRIDARGRLVHPARKAQVATVTIRHDLGSGAGQADLVLDRLRFGGALQPDDLTPLSLGVVANVDGVVEGHGQIRWTGSTVTSDGRFSTKDMSFAAAFGPVSGFATDIRFVDLLGLRTAPGQVMTMQSVNPGIDVRDGVIRYALRSNEQAVIEGGQWPFSGGTLELLPATLDLDARKPRNLTFRVVGLDAGAFINTMELENISATGTFDGLLPMIFDQHGGRIEGGILVARQQGAVPLILSSARGFTAPCDPVRQSGNLAYVGEVSNAQLGAFGKLAFDALKNLRYRCLTILLDGALDGEFVTQVRVNGINQGTEEARKSFLARPFLGLPFLFNVRIEAPFRGLMNTAAGFADPGVLIRNHLGEQYAPVGSGSGPLAVQPPDSDKKLEGDRK